MTTVASSPAAFVSPFEFRHVLRRQFDVRTTNVSPRGMRYPY